MGAGFVFQRRQMAVYFQGGLNPVQSFIGLGESGGAGAGYLGRHGLGADAIVVEIKPAPRQIGHGRRHHFGIGQKALAQQIGDAGIAGEARQAPGQALQVGIFVNPGAQRVRARITVRKIKRLHRHFQQDFMSELAGFIHPMLHIAGIGCEPQGDAGRQAGQCSRGGLGADAQTRHHNGDTQFARRGGRGIGGHGFAAIIGDARQRPHGRAFDQGRIGHQRRAGEQRLVNHHRRRQRFVRRGLRCNFALRRSGEIQHDFGAMHLAQHCDDQGARCQTAKEKCRGQGQRARRPWGADFLVEGGVCHGGKS